MTPFASRVPDPAVRRLTATLYGYAFLSDLVLLYPLYVVFFADTGLSVGQIASLFVIWSAAGILFEVPSGAWADVLSRRLLLCLARWWPPPVSRSGCWCRRTRLRRRFPALGRRWRTGLRRTGGVGLDRVGPARRGRPVRPGARAGADGGCAGRGGLRSARRPGARRRRVPGGRRGQRARLPARHGRRHPLPGTPRARRRTRPGRRTGGGRPAGGAAAPPRQDEPASPDDDGDLGWWDTLRAGVTQVRTRPPVRAAVLLVAVVAADWGALDEYTPLLALDTGVGAQAVPLLLLLLWAGVTVGGLLAPAGERLGGRGYAALLGLVGVALAGGALLRHPAGFVLIAVAFGAAQLATVLADARLQARITGTSRATVTSLAGMATDVLIIVTYAGYGLLATAAGNAVAFALTAGAYVVVAVVLLTRRERRTAAPTGVVATVPRRPGLTGARRRPFRPPPGRTVSRPCGGTTTGGRRGPGSRACTSARWPSPARATPRRRPPPCRPARRPARGSTPTARRRPPGWSPCPWRRPRCTPRSRSGGAAPAGWCRRW